MATYAQMLAWMEKQIGVTENPPNSNYSIYGATLDAALGPEVHGDGSDGWKAYRQGQSWCGTFLKAGAYALKHPIPVNPFYVPAALNEAKSKGIFTTTGAPGYMVIYNWDGGVPDHIGWVKRMLPSGQPATIEGNTSPVGLNANGGGVYRFGDQKGDPPARPLNTIVGYVKWEYDLVESDDDVEQVLFAFSSHPGDVYVGWRHNGLILSGSPCSLDRWAKLSASGRFPDLPDGVNRAPGYNNVELLDLGAEDTVFIEGFGAKGDKGDPGPIAPVDYAKLASTLNINTLVNALLPTVGPAVTNEVLRRITNG